MATLEELNRTPFGRDLYLLVHRLPRQVQADLDWELERGFQLEVLSTELFELALRPRDSHGHQPSLGLLGGPRHEGLASLLLWQHQDGSTAGWQEFCDHLLERPYLQAGLILTPLSGRLGALRAYPARQKLWNEVRCPVVQVFQDFPRAGFFTVEKNLFALPRVGRRIDRLRRLRRLAPW